MPKNKDEKELIQIAKPILFNTDMVKAILDGRKAVTRRPVKYKYSNTEMKMHTDKYGTRLIEIQRDIEGETFGKNEDDTTWHKLRGYIEPKPLYKQEDILYVRETWAPLYPDNESNEVCGYMYKVDSLEVYDRRYPNGQNWYWCGRWKPSIHMPKEAARIFLQVTDVRVERLQDITEQQAIKEGIYRETDGIDKGYFTYTAVHHPREVWDTARNCFRWKLWNFTIPKKDLDKYDWEANPWVWVVEFDLIKI